MSVYWACLAGYEDRGYLPRIPHLSVNGVELIVISKRYCGGREMRIELEDISIAFVVDST
jgi:hypothetical protein